MKAESWIKKKKDNDPMSKVSPTMLPHANCDKKMGQLGKNWVHIFIDWMPHIVTFMVSCVGFFIIFP